MEENKNKYGLSRKTNVAIAAIGGIIVVKDAPLAIGAILIIALVCVCIQGFLDYRKLWH